MGLFDFLKKKNNENLVQSNGVIEIYAPIAGKIVDLSEVPDDVFAKKMIGDGCAIVPKAGSVFAVADGEIEIFETNHAVSFDIDDKLEVIVHFGIDTVALDGKGFTRIAEPGTKVKKGDELVKYDIDFLKENAKSVITPVVISNMDEVENIEIIATGHVNVGDLLMKVVLKK